MNQHLWVHCISKILFVFVVLCFTVKAKYHFLNTNFSAHDIIEIDIDYDVVVEVLDIITDAESSLYVAKPGWGSDIRWTSPNNLKTYLKFSNLFNKLNVTNYVKEYIDFNEELVMYGGFIVTRKSCESTYFHMDWVDVGNEAFNIVTPIYNNQDGFGLLYMDTSHTVREYDYQIGKAIIIGDNFIHSTKPGDSEDPVLLLSFTFGTDKMEHWPAISKTALTQSNFIHMPNGQFLVDHLKKLSRSPPRYPS